MRAFINQAWKISSQIFLAAVVLLSDAAAATLVWTGAGGNNLISNSANWSPALTPAAGDVLIFGGTTQVTAELTSALTVGSLSFNASTSGFMLSGAGAYTINSGISNNSAATQTIDNAFNLGANQTWRAANGAFVINGPVANRGFLLTIDGDHGTSINGVLSGAGGLTKIGDGTLTVSGSNTYTGVTTLSAGTIVIGNNLAFGTGTLVLDGGTLQADGTPRSLANAITLDASSTIGGTQKLTFNGMLTQRGNRTLTVNNPGGLVISGGIRLSNARAPRRLTIAGSGDTTINSVISNGVRAKMGHLEKEGSGTLTLSGNSSNTFTGNVILYGGTLLLNKSAGLAVPRNITVGDGTGTDTLRLLGNEQISDTSIMTMNSSGVFDLNGWSEKVGTLSGSGSILLGTGTLTVGGNNTSTTYTGQLSGPGNFVKIGTGILTLSGMNNSTGLITANGGTIYIGSSGAVSNQTVLGASGSAIIDLNTISTTAGGLNLTAGTVQGTGVLNLAGDVNATSSGGVAAMVTVPLALSGTRVFNVSAGGAASDLDLTGPISGPGDLLKSGSGVLLVSGANNYGGSTVIDEGTLRIGGGDAIPNNSAVMLSDAAGATLDLANSNETIGSLSGGGVFGGDVKLGAGTLTLGANNSSSTYEGAITGTGGIVKIGTGTLTLAGTNSFTGPTIVSDGRVQLASSSALSSTTAVNLANATGVELELTANTASIGSLAGGGVSGGDVALGTGTLTTGSNNGNTMFAGIINGSGTLNKAGTGAFNLTGANTLTGGISVANGTLTFSAGGTAASSSSLRIETGATLFLDNTVTSNGNRINDTAPVIFDGGTLRFASGGTNVSETLGPLTLAGGNSQVLLAHGGPANRSTVLNFSSLGAITPGAMLNFGATGGTLGAGANGPQVYVTGLPLGFIGGWATVGADFAEYSTFGVRALTGYYTGDDGINVNDPTQIVLLASSSPASAYTLTRSGTTTDKGLNLTDAPLVDLNTSSTNTLNLASGGLLKSTSTPTSIIGAGRLTAGAISAGNLAVTVDGTSILSMAAPIINNAGPNGIYNDGDDGSVSLSTGGTGLLVLSGNNSYTGGTFLNSGTLQISSDVNLGAATGGVYFNGGTLNVTSSFAASPTRFFSVTAGLSGAIDVAAGQTFTLGSGVDRLQTGSAASQLRKLGGGTLVLASTNSAFSGTLHLDGGNLEMRAAQALGTGLLSLNGGEVLLRGDANTSFVSNVIAPVNSTIDVAGLTGSAANVAHTIETLSIGPVTLTVVSSDGAALNVNTTTLTGNATFATTSGNLTLGAVSGAYGLTKSGAGTLTFQGAKTYTGPTSVSEGVLLGSAMNFMSPTSALTIASGALLDLNNFNATVGALAGAGNVALGTGHLTAGQDNSSTNFSGVIAGSGSFAKTGSGVLTLLGANTYTGSTTITGGSIRLGAAERIANTSAVNVAPGATLNLNGFDESIGSLTGGGSVALGAGNLVVGSNNSTAIYTGVIAGAGSLTKVGSGTQFLLGGNAYSGPTTINAGALNLQNGLALGTATAGTTVNTGGELQLQSDVVILGEALTLRGSGVSGRGALRNMSDENFWDAPITLALDATIGADTGTLTLGGNIVKGAHLLWIAGAGTVNIDGTVSGTGPGGITKEGLGTLILSGPNTYTGTTTVDGGVLQIFDAAALGAADLTSGSIVGAFGAMWVADDVGLAIGDESLLFNGTGIDGTGSLLSLEGANSWAGPLTLGTDSAIGVNAGSLLLSDGIGESGGPRSLTKVGLATLNLSGGNTYTGATFVGQGKLHLFGGSTLASTNITVAPNATFSVANGALLPSTASLTVHGTAIFHNPVQSFAAVNGSSDGVITLEGTSLDLWSGTLDGTIENGATPGSLHKTGPGTLVLTGNNTFTGITTISQGVLAANSAAALGAGSTLVLAGGTLRTDASFTLARSVALGVGGGTIDTNGNTLVLSGALSGATVLTKTGAGLLAVTGSENDAFSGGIQVNAGELRVTGELLSPVTIAAGAEMDGSGIVGNLLVQSGGRISPGVGLGPLNSNHLTLANGATLDVQIGGTIPIAQYDQLSVTGLVTLAGNLQVSIVNGFVPAAGDTFFILLNDGMDPVFGSFTGIAQDDIVSFSGQSFVVSYTGDIMSGSIFGGNDVALQVIPEPSSRQNLVLAGLFVLGIFRPRKSYQGWRR